MADQEKIERIGVSGHRGIGVQETTTRRHTDTPTRRHAYAPIPRYIITILIGILIAGCGSSDITTTIQGTVRYEAKQYNAGGFTGILLQKAVRYARVEVVDSQTGSVLCEGETDANGTYSVSFPFRRSHVYVRVISEAAPPGAATISVKSLKGRLYAVGSADFSVSSGSQTNVDITITNFQPVSPAGAFNILDVMTIGAEFVHHLSGTYPPALSAFWQVGNQDGTQYCFGYDPYYCPMGEGIYVLGGYSDGSGNTDQYDDDVLWHEYGHCIASKYSRDDSPGGYHLPNNNDLDLRVSWSEGWGDFFPGAVKTWLYSTNPGLISSATGTLSYYVDTLGTGVGISFDFGNPGGSPYYYASGEVAVAKVLLDLMNNVSFGMQPVWDVVSSFTSTYPATPVNLEAFWDGWKLQRSATFVSEKATLEAIYGDRQIFFREDSFEPDDTLPVSRASFTVNGPGETHYLYKNDGSADVDIIPFDVASGMTYTIRTVQLHNGADTYMRIISGSTGTYVSGAANDNASGSFYTPLFNCNTCLNPPFCTITICHENGGNLLGSEIILPDTTPPGRYYVEISSSPNRPASAGRYGTYTLTITSP